MFITLPYFFLPTKSSLHSQTYCILDKYGEECKNEQADSWISNRLGLDFDPKAGDQVNPGNCNIK